MNEVGASGNSVVVVVVVVVVAAAAAAFKMRPAFLGDILSFTSSFLITKVDYTTSSKITKGSGHKFSEFACMPIV